MHSKRTLQWATLSLLGLMTAAVWGCWAEPFESPVPPNTVPPNTVPPNTVPPNTVPPNVVLAVLDTVRADHLSSYGYERPTTPHIDALTEMADRYTRCYSTAPWTLPSHASMMTGLYPFQHGAQARRTGGKVVELPLPEESRTLAEMLKGEGYRTGAIVANGIYLGPRFGFAQGFDRYDTRKPRTRKRKGKRRVPRRGPEVNRRAFEWLDQGSNEEPFFLFVNYMDAHRPYNIDPLPAERSAELPSCDPENPQPLLNQLVSAVLEAEEAPSPELVQRVVSQYDCGVAHVDLAIGALINGLKQRGHWENTLFILTSDHGEYFGEHDLVEHSKDVYEEALHVPLIVRSPGQSEGRVIEERSTIAAIPYMVAGALPRGSSRRLREKFKDPGTAQIFAELRYTRARHLNKPYGHRFMRERTVIYSERYKAIFSTDGQHELYNVSEDPSEDSDLFDVAEHQAIAEALVQRAEQKKLRGEQAGLVGIAVEYTPEELEALVALGYVEGNEEKE